MNKQQRSNLIDGMKKDAVSESALALALLLEALNTTTPDDPEDKPNATSQQKTKSAPR